MTALNERLIDRLIEPGQPSPWMRLDDAARYLTVSPSWLDRSDCPRSRLGRRVVFLRTDLDAFAIGRMTHRIDHADV